MNGLLNLNQSIFVCIEGVIQRPSLGAVFEQLRGSGPILGAASTQFFLFFGFEPNLGVASNRTNPGMRVSNFYDLRAIARFLI